MPRKLIASLTLCSLVLAGCQSTGGMRQTPPPAPAPHPTQQPATTPGQPPATEGSTTPWDQARQRGMAFRAVGNEPGWTAEVEKSHQPAMYLTLDYGQRRLQVSQADVSIDKQAGTITFRGQSADGSPVSMVVQRGQCQDGMSGQQMDASAKLQVGPKTYTGCGRFLLQ